MAEIALLTGALWPALGLELKVGGGLFGLVVFVLDVIALVSVLGGRGSVSHKLGWTLAILLLPCVGMGLYFLVGRGPEDR